LIEVVGEGSVPAAAEAAGISRAICFRLSYTNPYWTMQGTTRHEIVQHGRVVSKVAVNQNGTWLTNPDIDQQDEARWAEFACAGSYRSEALSP
jgi:hypothetical protein